jgi:hypothetical protein
VKLVSICSNHILGTALPPPSVGGLRPNSPVTCGFATSHPALSRRPRAVGAGTTRLPWTVASSRQGAWPQPVGFRGCSVRAGTHLLLLAAPACSGSTRPGSHPAKPSAFAPPPPHAASADARSPSAASLRSRMASFVSELASHEVPGFGAPALPSALGLEALASASAIARTTASPRPAGGGEPASVATAPLMASQVPRRGHLYPYKGARGAAIVSARRGELMRSFRGVQVSGL